MTAISKGTPTTICSSTQQSWSAACNSSLRGTKNRYIYIYVFIFDFKELKKQRHLGIPYIQAHLYLPFQCRGKKIWSLRPTAILLAAILEPICIPAPPSWMSAILDVRHLGCPPSWNPYAYRHRHLGCPPSLFTVQRRGRKIWSLRPTAILLAAIFVRKIFGPKFIYYLSPLRPVGSSFSTTSNQGIPIFVHIFGSNGRHLCSQNIWSQIYILLKSTEAGGELIFYNQQSRYPHVCRHLCSQNIWFQIFKIFSSMASTVPTCANNPTPGKWPYTPGSLIIEEDEVSTVPTCANNPTPGKWPYTSGSLIIEDEEDYIVPEKDEDSISNASTVAL